MRQDGASRLSGDRQSQTSGFRINDDMLVIAGVIGALVGIENFKGQGATPLPLGGAAVWIAIDEQGRLSS
jgi:hypothetical protein